MFFGPQKGLYSFSRSGGSSNEESQWMVPIADQERNTGEHRKIDQLLV